MLGNHTLCMDEQVLQTYHSEESTCERSNDLCEAVAQHGTRADSCDSGIIVGMERLSLCGRERSVGVSGFGWRGPEGVRFGVENVW